MSRLDYRSVSGCRFCGLPEQGHYRMYDHPGWTPPTMDQLKTRMRYRAIRRELRKLMDQLPKGTKRGRL